MQRKDLGIRRSSGAIECSAEYVKVQNEKTRNSEREKRVDLIARHRATESMRPNETDILLFVGLRPDLFVRYRLCAVLVRTRDSASV